MTFDAYNSLLAEQASDRSSGMQVLELIQRKQNRQRMKDQVIRAQYINPYEITG